MANEPGVEGRFRVVFAGGGTGGHIFPAIALAREFQKRREGVEVWFVGTHRGLDSKLIPDYGYQLKMISVESFMGKDLVGKIRSLGLIPVALFQSLLILKRFHPHLVIGLGGYSSGPVVLAAFLLGIRRVIIEPNSIPGFANRLVGRFVHKIFIAYPQTANFFPSAKTIITGNPLRPEVMPGGLSSSVRQNSDFRILVLGGSQGSRKINTSMVEALEKIARLIPGLKILHQTGVADRDLIQEAYRQSGFPGRVVSFITDMASAYKEADLVVARAGATTLAEIAAWGKPAILIPYPYAANQHQRKNAQIFSETGAAVVVEDSELDGEKLAEVILELFNNPERLGRMAEQSRKLARLRAGEDIVNICLKLVNS